MRFETYPFYKPQPQLTPLFADIRFAPHTGGSEPLAFVLVVQTDPEPENDDPAHGLFRYTGHVIERKNLVANLTERTYRIESIQTCEKAEELFSIGPLDSEKMLMFIAVLLRNPVQCQVSRRLNSHCHEGFAVGVEISRNISDPVLENTVFHKLRMAGNFREWHRVIGEWLPFQLNKQMSQKYDVYFRLKHVDGDPPSHVDPLANEHYFIY